MEAKDIINVLETARDLMKFGHTTTLDIKEELRRRFPNKKWFQSDVSDIMIDAYDNKLIKNIQLFPCPYKLWQKSDKKERNFWI